MISSHTFHKFRKWIHGFIARSIRKIDDWANGTQLLRAENLPFRCMAICDMLFGPFMSFF